MNLCVIRGDHSNLRGFERPPIRVRPLTINRKTEWISYTAVFAALAERFAIMIEGEKRTVHCVRQVSFLSSATYRSVDLPVRPLHIDVAEAHDTTQCRRGEASPPNWRVRFLDGLRRCPDVLKIKEIAREGGRLSRKSAGKDLERLVGACAALL
jgi:hypothetical protein